MHKTEIGEGFSQFGISWRSRDANAADFIRADVGVRSIEGGLPSERPKALGWLYQPITTMGAVEPIWHAEGRSIGWINGDELYLDLEASYAAAQELARTGNQVLPTTQNVLWKRLDEEGLLVSKDRDRHTTRIIAADVRRRVLHLSAIRALGLPPGGPTTS